MRRTKALALALVNWKGVFYERYLLDEQVTALEGANGAGKTTVMIAAYVVLLPDMTRLRFTNLGESAATGGDKGIYGRLGDPDSPSYAAMDFRLAHGERLLCGVHLERRAEPSVELTPFIAAGLADEVPLQDVLLDRGERDAVPDLNRLRELVALAGGRLLTFAKLGDYFAELFERGVTPLRLTGDEERTKLNEMLRTSMVGGISRALTGGLREFLLRAETGLADTLKRMRANLDACRRTRIEVEAAQRMEAEIHGVYEAGQEMFAAAVHACRERAEELHQRVERARKEAEAADAEAEARAGALRERQAEHDQVRRSLEQTRGELEGAARVLEAVRTAHRIASRMARREKERVQAAAGLEASRRAEAEHRRARERARGRRAQAQERLKCATLGLADFQQGLDQLHRRAAAFEQVSRRLEEARGAQPDLGATPDSAAAARRECERRLEPLDRERVRLDGLIATATERRREHARVSAALAELRGGPAEPGEALDVARRALCELRDLDALAAELPDLPGRVDEARALALRQAALRQAAERLRTPEHALGSAEALRAAFARADTALEEARAGLAAERAAAAEADRGRERAEEDVGRLEGLVPHWRAARSLAAALRETWCPDRPLESRADVEAFRRRLAEERDRLREESRAGRAGRDDLAAQAERLEHNGGPFSDALLRARDAVEGELLAGHFEDVPAGEAGPMQACLGPLCEAIVVEDAGAAARRLVQAEDRPSTVWLVDGQTRLAVDPDALESEGAGERIEQDVLVRSAAGVRLTRIPALPTLGRAARARCLAGLRAGGERVERELVALDAAARRVDQALAEAGGLLADAALLERADPSPELAEAGRRIRFCCRARDRHTEASRKLQEELRAAEARRGALCALLGDAHLLDPPDRGRAQRALEERLEEVRRARARLGRCAASRSALEQGMDVLRVPPPGDEELTALCEALDAACGERDRLCRALDALRYVEANLPALGWSDAPAAIREQQALRPALEEQLRRAEAELQAAEGAEAEAEIAMDAAVAAVRKVHAALEQLEAALARDREELAEIGIEDAGDEVLASAERTHADLSVRLAGLDGHDRQAGARVAEARVRHETAAAKAEERRGAVAEELAQWRPQAERWERLQQEARDAGVLEGVLSPAHLERTRGAGSVNLYPVARSKGELLVERLALSEGGAERARAVAALLAGATQESTQACLRAWLDAREWLRRRVPPQISEVDDPLETLARVRDHLGRLRDRLAQQERTLRGQSEDVARNIETQRRKARREVSRLNQELRNVRFGSIHGVQIQVRPVESRERVLLALREGEAQQLLFQSDMPVEEAMAELFKRYGGGPSGGQRLLDYREYLDLQVEVLRQAGRQWEPANPTRMSTGEAIGVGAAIMMVVLTAWERHANLLRTQRAAGTLRLLFLDEANRLSQDNLGVLFELCQGLELQLLIAAPEVAQAEGNTTYRLVRQVDEDGREVVRVTGRRTLRGVA